MQEDKSGGAESTPLRPGKGNWEIPGHIQVTLFLDKDSPMEERLIICRTCGTIVGSERDGVRSHDGSVKKECCRVRNYDYRTSRCSRLIDGHQPNYLEWCRMLVEDIGVDRAFVQIGAPWNPREVAVYRKA